MDFRYRFIDVGYTMDSKYAVMWRQCDDAIGFKLVGGVIITYRCTHNAVQCVPGANQLREKDI